MDFFDKIDNTLWAIKTVPIYFSLQLVLEVRLNYVEIVLKNSATLSPRALSWEEKYGLTLFSLSPKAFS